MTKDKRQFTWLSDSQSPRKGPRLKKGELHNVSDYPEAVLMEWAKTGHLMFEEIEETKKTTKGGKD